MKALITKLLNIPGVIVEDSQEIEGTLILSVKVENKRYLVKDLPMSDRQVILRVNRRRFNCKNCSKTFSETLDFVGSKKNFTHRYAEKITEEVIHSDINNVAKNNGLTTEEVESMLKDIAKKKSIY